jgi:hypothetical protein
LYYVANNEFLGKYSKMSEKALGVEGTSKDCINSILANAGINGLSFSTNQCELLDFVFESYSNAFGEMLKVITGEVVPFYNQCLEQINTIGNSEARTMEQEEIRKAKKGPVQIGFYKRTITKLQSEDCRNQIISELKHQIRLLLIKTIDEIITSLCCDIDPKLRRQCESVFGDAVRLISYNGFSIDSSEYSDGELIIKLRRLYEGQIVYDERHLGVQQVASLMNYKLAILLNNIDPYMPEPERISTRFTNQPFGR